MLRADIETAARRLRRANCCGVMEYSGLHAITSKEKAQAIRRAGYAVGRSGFVVCTITPGVVAALPHLRAGGFKAIAQFINPRSGNSVLVMGAQTLQTGGGMKKSEQLREGYGRV